MPASASTASQGSTVAISPILNDLEQRSLSEALAKAGYRVVALNEPHEEFVTMRVLIESTCQPWCRNGLRVGGGHINDPYRRYAMVVAQDNTGTTLVAAAKPIWSAVLQSDGLSAREQDYLPSMLRVGTVAFGKTLTGERLSPRGPNIDLCDDTYPPCRSEWWSPDEQPSRLRVSPAAIPGQG